MTFEEVDGYARYYLERFRDRIQRLAPEERERVTAVISLERFRAALTHKKAAAGYAILRENKVKIKYLVRYAIYLIRRVVKHESYGFNGK